MSGIQDLIQHALDQNYNKASEVFGDIMTLKMNDIMDQEKIKLAAEIYNDGVEYTQNDIDQTDDLDIEDDTEIEVDPEDQEDIDEIDQMDVDDIELSDESLDLEDDLEN